MQWLKSEVGIFLLKVAGIYLLWYLIYELWLLPDGTLDQWVTTNIVSVSAGMLEMLGYDFYATGRLIGIGESAGIYLVNGCSGISAIGLFVGFVVAYPGAWIPRIAFIFIGIGVIYLVNIIRIIVLTITQVQAPEMFTVTHDYSTTAIFYIVIFVLWMIWANFGDSTRTAGSARETA
jgi:exosortase family protein XrtF